jgi:murein DD-endopeptidase MepM/ murein hydrolase activator NlpD
MRALRIFLLALALPLVGWAVMPVASDAGLHGQASSLQSRIDGARAALARKHGRAVLLTTDVTAFTRRIDALQVGITRLEGRLSRLQADLDAKRAELLRLRKQLDAARAHLERLRARLEHSQHVLARRLVQLYEAGQPDLVTVVLESHGFADLLENGSFLHRIGAQDRQIVLVVRAAKAEATIVARRLSGLEARQRRVTAIVAAHRNEVAAIQGQLVHRREGYARQRDAKAAALATVRDSESHLRGKIDVLQSQAAAVDRRIQAASAPSGGAGALPAGPIRQGGSIIWPVNGPISSPFCERRPWEACHPGIDIVVPEGTPIRAAAAGNVIIAGPVSGYGNYTCIQHGGPLSTCYGHQSSIGVSVGQRVAQGQVIGLSGCTGLCFGAHLHFETRINGSVVNPMNYLG